MRVSWIKVSGVSVNGVRVSVGGVRVGRMTFSGVRGCHIMWVWRVSSMPRQSSCPNVCLSLTVCVIALYHAV